MTQKFNLCLVGFGNVGRALVRLLRAKEHELRERYAIEWRIAGIASRRLGWIAAPDGLNPEVLLNSSGHAAGDIDKAAGPAAMHAANVHEWLAAARGNVLFEATSLNRADGQPAIEHIQAALDAGAHAISANKGPVVFALDELTRLARAKGRRFLFESAVMDGTPIFSLFRETLPAAKLRGFRGVLNSTTNVVLAGIEAGLTLDAAVKKAQELGVAETNPADDLDGWDAAAKVAALAIALMGVPLRLDEIERTGIRGLAAADVRAARAAGNPYKLVCRAERKGGRVVASVRPERVPPGDPLAAAEGTSSAIHFELDFLPGLTIVEHHPGNEATAYGMLSDFIRAVGVKGKV